MGKSRFNRITLIGVLGGIFVLLVLVLGTFWTGQTASKDTKTAVRYVSLMYLDELADRRSQVVAGTLKEYEDEMDIALGLLTREDLSSTENLMDYQARMKQLYGLEKFAFIDKDGVIYTSTGTRNDIDSYDVDYLNLPDTEFFIKNEDDDNKKIVLITSVDNLQCEDKTLVACFMETSMMEWLESVSMETNANNNTTVCNIYTLDGIPLANQVLGGMAEEDNLFTALEKAKFEDEYSLEDFKNSFSTGGEGDVSFTYSGVSGTMHYVPIDNSEWMLTYLIKESTINEEINTISYGIIRRSLIQSLLATVVLVIMFIFMIYQLRRVATERMERQISETENRMKQQELEEQLAMQEELLEQEKRQVEQDKMITALASDYRSVYYVDLDTDKCSCYRNDGFMDDNIFQGDSFSFIEKFTEYANDFVDEKYKEGFLEFIKPQNIKKALERERIIGYRYLIHKDGNSSYEMLRMAGVRHAEDRTDHIVHAVGVGFSDIDEEMKEDLEQRQALSEALKVAEESSKAKTVFLSNMSHEIRTPMNAIIGLDTLALNEPDISESTRDYLEKIDNSAKHLLGLINDILDMSRIESGRLLIKSEEFSFSKLLEQVNTIISGQCKEKGLNYDCKVNGALDDYYIGDDTKLRQILINILGNAVKFTPEDGNVELTVEKTAEFDGKSTLRFTMSDTGIGMSKEYLPKIFETFSQEDALANNKYGSSGLGMAITKNIVEMMNGKIEVDSEKGKGTTFVVTLTLLNTNKGQQTEGEDIKIIASDLSVLVVDDDEVAGNHAKLVLDKVGIKAEIAHSGQEAIDMVKLHQARQNPFNLIILDWQMPEMDGVETTRQIRSVIGDESAIIILTAYNWDDIANEATEAGVDSFIAKPIFPSNIIDEFQKALKAKHLNKEEKKKADLAGKKILLAEDVDINAEIILKILKMGKMEADRAENGRIVVDKFAASQEGYYDAILMDMRMPEMDGLEATKLIRNMDRSDAKTIPIIALTANAFDEDVQRSLQAGLNAHLTKPVNPKVLFETLGNIL